MITPGQLQRHRANILKKINQLKHQIKAIEKLQDYHRHCIEGYEKLDCTTEPEHGLKVKQSVAITKHRKKVVQLMSSFDNCRDEQALLLKKVEAIEKAVEICGISETSRTRLNADGTKKRGRPPKNPV